VSKEQIQEEYQEGPNYTLYIVGYFALLAVAIVLTRPFHLSMGGMFFCMVGAGVALALIVLAGKAVIHKVQNQNLTLKDLYHIQLGYDPAEAQAMFEEEDDEGIEQNEPEPQRIIEQNGLALSETFQPSIEKFLCMMVSIFGIRRSGKSTLMLALYEEMVKYDLMTILFDTMGEYEGLASRSFLKRPSLAGSESMFNDLPAEQRAFFELITPKTAYTYGQKIMQKGLQAVINLKSFDEESAALVMIEIIRGVNAWQEARRNVDRPPMCFFLDEAQKWLPENRADMANISQDAQTALENAFIRIVVEMGGKNGLGLVVASQRYSRLKKSLLQSHWKFYLKQSEEIDLARYKRQGIDPDEAKALGQGEVIAYGPDVAHFRFICRRSHAPHEGHTPGLDALKKHTRVLSINDLAARPGPMANIPMREQIAVQPKPVEITDIDRIIAVLDEAPTLPIRKIAERTGIKKDTVALLIEEIGQRGLRDVSMRPRKNQPEQAENED
jgi:hypothetical protein